MFDGLMVMMLIMETMSTVSENERSGTFGVWSFTGHTRNTHISGFGLYLMVMVIMVTMPTVSEKERLGTFGAEQLLTERCTGPILSNEPSPDVNLAFQYLFF